VTPGVRGGPCGIRRAYARSMTLAQISLGVAGTLGPDRIARIARAAEDAGLHALWVNDTPSGDALAALAAAARVTSTLGLASGVVPVDRRSASEIAGAVRDGGIPQERLTVGIGAGGRRQGALAMVRDAAIELRSTLSARVLVGALGPRMRRLAANDADGPLLSWLTPAVARDEAAEAHAIAADHVALYVRTALDPAASTRLAEEADRYGGYPAYAANFARLGIGPRDTVMDAATFDALLPAYRAAVDEVVIRAIPATDDLEAYVRFAGSLADR
jgi:alkanesulfonate monooxygenase SsuD/methylene tetrahydromethanopterin reductase-like flavin-dependent oxidoreductase (luciferase family)